MVTYIRDSEPTADQKPKKGQKVGQEKGLKAAADKVLHARTTTAAGGSTPTANRTNSSSNCSTTAPAPANAPDGAVTHHPWSDGCNLLVSTKPAKDGLEWAYRRWASVLPTYVYTKCDKKNVLPSGFILPLQYADAVSEALCSGLDKGIRKGLLQLDTEHPSLVGGGRVWKYSVNSKVSNRTRAWQFLTYQFEARYLRSILAHCIEFMPESKIKDGEGGANCVIFHCAKHRPMQKKHPNDEFPDLPVESELLTIMLEFVPRDRPPTSLRHKLFGR